MGGVRAFSVIVGQPFPNASHCFWTSFKGVQIYAFILERPPEPLNHPIIDPAPFTIHADLDVRISQHVDPMSTCELAALISVEYLWRTVFGQRLFQGLDAEVHVHGVGMLPRKDLATVPVHDVNKVQEAPPHWDIGDVRTPDLVRTVNHDVPQQRRPYFMLRMLSAGIGLVVDWNQPYKTY